MTERPNRTTPGPSRERRSPPRGLLNRWIRMTRMTPVDRNSKVTRIRAAILHGQYDDMSRLDAAIDRLTIDLPTV